MKVHNNIKKIFLMVFSLIICNSINFAENYHLTLDESIEIAKEKSYSMLGLIQDFKIAENNLKSATSSLKTHIDLDLTFPKYSNDIGKTPPDSLGNMSFYTAKSLTYAGTLLINQPLLTNGNIYVENIIENFDNLVTNKRDASLNTRIRFRQPLDAFYGYNKIRSDLKSAELAYERSSKALKREELNLIYSVSNSYYNLLSLQKSFEIAKLDLERQTDAYEISKNKYESGLIREVDALQMEVDLAEAQNNYDIAILNQNSYINSFKELIGIDLNDTISLNSDLSYEIVIVDTEKAVQLALKNRLEIREQEIQIELQKLSVKQQKAAGMIKSTIDAYFGRAGVYQDPKLGTLYTNIPNSIDYSYRDYLNRPSSYGIEFTVSIPIFDWGENRALVRSAEAKLKQNIYSKEETERSIETEVRNLASNVNSSLKRLQLLEKNVAVAEKSFEITRQRFSDGDIDSQALALERNRLNNAYTTHLRAYINYQLTLADLMRKTFYDFKNDEEVK